MTDAAPRPRPGRAGTPLVLCIALLLLPGCRLLSPASQPQAPQQTQPSQNLPALKSADVDPLALRADVDSFAFTFRSQVSSAASEISSATTDRAIRESALRWKIQVIPAIDVARLAPDPRSALAGIWAICVRQRALLGGPFGEQTFGGQVDIARRTVADLEKQIVALAGRYLPPEAIAELSAEMERVAAEAPTIAGFDVTLLRGRPGAPGGPGAPAGQNEKEPAGPLAQLLELPMMPFAVVGAIGDTPSEIRNFANVAAAFGETARGIPEQLRWQSELLLLESEDHPVAKGVDEIGRAAESVAQTARSFQESIDRADGPVTALHETVQEAHATAAQVDITAARAQDIAASLDSHAAALSQTAAAWESTVHAVHDVLDAWTKAHPPSANPGPGLDIKDVSAAADRTRAAVSEARGLVSDVESANLKDKIAEVSAASDASIDHAADRLDGVLSKFVWSLAAVVILGIAAAAVARIIVRRMT